MQLSEESFAILSILCLLSPDRGGNMCLRDRQQLNRLQVKIGISHDRSLITVIGNLTLGNIR